MRDRGHISKGGRTLSQDHEVQGGILPRPDRPSTGLMTYDAKDPDVSFPPIDPLRPPKGAPNVLVVLLDDVGFGASSAFGGPCSTPTAERLAASGLKYNRFHTTALCSPTRQALLTGRNHHAKDPDVSFPPIDPLRPPKGAPNVLVVLLDDVGFGASSAFGGPCSTPTAERLAASGLKYNRFHTTALCSPTRQALLTGRNHHA